MGQVDILRALSTESQISLYGTPVQGSDFKEFQ